MGFYIDEHFEVRVFRGDEHTYTLYPRTIKIESSGLLASRRIADVSLGSCLVVAVKPRQPLNDIGQDWT